MFKKLKQLFQSFKFKLHETVNIVSFMSENIILFALTFLFFKIENQIEEKERKKENELSKSI